MYHARAKQSAGAGMEYVEIEPFTWEDAINETTSYSTVTRNVSIKSISRPSDSLTTRCRWPVVVTGAWQNDASVVKAIVSGTSRVTSGSCSANLYLIITPDSSRAVNAKIRVEGFIIWGLGWISLLQPEQLDAGFDDGKRGHDAI